MTNTITARTPSATPYGLGVKVTATATPGDLIHTAVNSTTAGTYDEVILYATNNHTASVVVTVQWGTAATEQNIQVSIPPKAGLWPLIPGLLLQNAYTVKIFAGVTNVITVFGRVHLVTD